MMSSAHLERCIPAVGKPAIPQLELIPEEGKQLFFSNKYEKGVVSPPVLVKSTKKGKAGAGAVAFVAGPFNNDIIDGLQTGKLRIRCALWQDATTDSRRMQQYCERQDESHHCVAVHGCPAGREPGVWVEEGSSCWSDGILSGNLKWTQQLRGACKCMDIRVGPLRLQLLFEEAADKSIVSFTSLSNGFISRVVKKISASAKTTTPKPSPAPCMSPSTIKDGLSSIIEPKLFSQEGPSAQQLHETGPVSEPIKLEGSSLADLLVDCDFLDSQPSCFEDSLDTETVPQVVRCTAVKPQYQSGGKRTRKAARLDEDGGHDRVRRCSRDSAGSSVFRTPSVTGYTTGSALPLIFETFEPLPTLNPLAFPDFEIV